MLTPLIDFFQYEFLTYALLGTVLLSIAAGMVSPFVVAKKQAFMGEAVAHSTLLGLVLSGIILGNVDNALALFFLSLLITLIAIIPLTWYSFKNKGSNDSLIGVFLTTTLSLGVIIHSFYPTMGQDLMGLLFGNILTLTLDDLVIQTIITLITIIIIGMNYRKWVFFTYDEESAMIAGLPIKLMHYGFIFLLTVLIVSMVKVSGAVLVTTLLVIPGLSALKISRNMKQCFIYSIAHSLFFSIIGLVMANVFEIPPGATLSLSQFIGLCLVIIVKKRKLLLIN